MQNLFYRFITTFLGLYFTVTILAITVVVLTLFVVGLSIVMPIKLIVQRIIGYFKPDWYRACRQGNLDFLDEISLRFES